MFLISGGEDCRPHRANEMLGMRAQAFDLIHKRSGGDFWFWASNVRQCSHMSQQIQPGITRIPPPPPPKKKKKKKKKTRKLISAVSRSVIAKSATGETGWRRAPTAS